MMTTVRTDGAVKATEGGLAGRRDLNARACGRRLNAHDLRPLVRAGVVCTHGYRVERIEPPVTFNPQLLTYLKDWSGGHELRLRECA